MDTLKSLMSTMAGTTTRQVAEQVKKAMDAAASARPVPVGGPPIGRKAGRPFTSWNMAESDRLPLERQRGRVVEEPIAQSAQGKTTSLKSTMADTITRQVAGQVKKAMDAAGSAQPVPVEGPPNWPKGRSFLRLMEHGREVARSDWSDRLPLGRWGDTQWRSPLPDSRREKLQSRQLPPPPTRRSLPLLMTAPPRPQNDRKYYKFHEQSEHTTIEC
ncbi:hypothetical protein Cgig2_032314 [Carnegiea gigantea]|uniref:Uncharacterized protein n=1 Tax=Carnegiea gigantea TaxID=171969 RepID=A0A9Q1GYQ7_9CARY|nr:hypothetical protein Cgig2_032314 [Carnegiea gigantea]